MRFCLFFVCLLLAWTIPASAGTKLSLGFLDDEPAVICAAVLEAAYAKLGIEVEAVSMPAQRSLVESNDGRLDGEMGRIATIQAQYPNLIRIDVPIFTFQGVAWACNNTTYVDGWESLRGYHVGVRIGVRFAEIGTQGYPNIYKARSDEDAFQLLMEGRLDFVVSSYLVGRKIGKKLGIDCLRVSGKPLVVGSMYHYLNKKNAALIPKITRTLQTMEQSGESEAIRQQAILDLGNQAQ